LKTFLASLAAIFLVVLSARAFDESSAHRVEVSAPLVDEQQGEKSPASAIVQIASAVAGAAAKFRGDAQPRPMREARRVGP
jgi:hypothetical protein